MKVIEVTETNGFRLAFDNLNCALKFDEGDKSKDTYHWLECLNKVDVFAELEHFEIFVEVKWDKPILDQRKQLKN